MTEHYFNPYCARPLVLFASFYLCNYRLIWFCLKNHLSFSMKNGVRIRIIFSKLIHKNIVTSSTNQVYGEYCKFPRQGLGGKAYKHFGQKCKKIVYSFTIFGIRYKPTVTLTTFTDTLKTFSF